MSMDVVSCSAITELEFFGGNDRLQLSFCARGRSLWSAHERADESVGKGRETGWSRSGDVGKELAAAADHCSPFSVQHIV